MLFSLLGFDHFECSFRLETVMFVFGLVQVAATRAAAEDAYHAAKKGTVFTRFTLFVVMLSYCLITEKH
jgi:hypothetical protein